MTDKNTAGGLLSTRTCFKPFKYPWAYEAFILARTSIRNDSSDF